MDKKTNTLELRNGRWFENGKWLTSKDYIYRADCLEGSSITSYITDEVYRIGGRKDRRVTYG